MKESVGRANSPPNAHRNNTKHGAKANANWRFRSGENYKALLNFLVLCVIDIPGVVMVSVGSEGFQSRAQWCHFGLFRPDRYIDGAGLRDRPGSDSTQRQLISPTFWLTIGRSPCLSITILLPRTKHPGFYPVNAFTAFKSAG